MKTNPETIIHLSEVLNERRGAMTAEESEFSSVALLVHGNDHDSITVALRRFADAIDEGHIDMDDFGGLNSSAHALEFICSRGGSPASGQ